MLPLLFPVGLLAAVVLVVVSSPYEALVAVGVGVLLIPVLWRLRVPPAGDDPDSDYWRIKPL